MSRFREELRVIPVVAWLIAIAGGCVYGISDAEVLPLLTIPT